MPRSERRFSVQMNWEFQMSSKGTIKRIVSDKGFGFVADESGQEVLLPSVGVPVVRLAP